MMAAMVARLSSLLAAATSSCTTSVCFELQKTVTLRGEHTRLYFVSSHGHVEIVRVFVRSGGVAVISATRGLISHTFNCLYAYHSLPARVLVRSQGLRGHAVLLKCRGQSVGILCCLSKPLPCAAPHPLAQILNCCAEELWEIGYHSLSVVKKI